jgi:drug/metabolite transporter (DMT)-like permease
VTGAHPLRAVFLLLAALSLFAALDATAKILAARHPVPWLVWGRYAVHLAFMLVVFGPRLGRRLASTGRPLLQILRALMLTGVTAFNIAALTTLPLAETTAILFVAPLLVALLAGPWLGEKVGAFQFATAAVGFAGVLLIVKPGAAAGALDGTGVLFAIAAAACYALYQLMTRQLTPTEDTMTMVFYTALIGTLATTIAMPWFAGMALPGAFDLMLIASLGLYGGCGHYLLTQAFREAPASTLSPLLYAQLVWATLLGALLFGTLPDAGAFVGMLLIAGGGIAIGLRERKRPLPA